MFILKDARGQISIFEYSSTFEFEGFGIVSSSYFSDLFASMYSYSNTSTSCATKNNSNLMSCYTLNSLLQIRARNLDSATSEY